MSNKIKSFDQFLKEAEYQGRDVELNKPFRDSGSGKKFGVYVKNDKGNVVKVGFGDPNMEIKRDDPEKRKSFRARHNCDSPGPRHKARYWSCKFWSTKSVSDLLESISIPGRGRFRPRRRITVDNSDIYPDIIYSFIYSGPGEYTISPLSKGTNQVKGHSVSLSYKKFLHILKNSNIIK